MSEYWVSNEKKYCRYCNTYISTDKTSLSRHENGNRHKFNVRRFLQLQEKEQQRESRKEQDVTAQLKAIERAAEAQYQQDMLYGTGHAAQEQMAAYQQRQLLQQQQEEQQGDHSDLHGFYEGQGMLGAGGGEAPAPPMPTVSEGATEATEDDMPPPGMSTADALGGSTPTAVPLGGGAEAVAAAEQQSTSNEIGSTDGALPLLASFPGMPTLGGEGMSEKMQQIFQQAAAAAAAAVAAGGAPPPFPGMPGMPPLPGMPGMPPGMPPLPGSPLEAPPAVITPVYSDPSIPRKKTEEEIEEEQRRIWAEEDAAWERKKRRQALERQREEERERERREEDSDEDEEPLDEELEARFEQRDGRERYGVDEEEEAPRKAPNKRKKKETIDTSTPYGAWKASAPAVAEDTGGNPYGQWETVEVPEPEALVEVEATPGAPFVADTTPMEPIATNGAAGHPVGAKLAPLPHVPQGKQEEEGKDLNAMFNELDKGEYDDKGPVKIEDLLEEKPAVATFKKRGRKRKGQALAGNVRKRITLQQIEEENFKR